MSQVLSSPIPITTSHTDDSFDNLASGQYPTPELADLVSRIQSWRDHKTFKTQPIPNELKSSISHLLASGLYSRTALAKQLGISYNQIFNIEANFIDHPDLSANEAADLNFLPFKIVPHNQNINSTTYSNSSGSNPVDDHLNTKFLNSQPIADPVLVNQVKDIVIHKADGAILTLPINLQSELIYNITQLFLCSK